MPAALTIVGLGPGNPSMRTAEAIETLSAAETIILRTAIHPGIEDIAADPRAIACDDLYESRESFDLVYAAIVDRVLGHAVNRVTVFAVPGHPLVGERCTRLLLEAACKRGLDTRVVAGVSALDAVAASLRVDLSEAQPQIIDATALAAWLDHEPFNGAIPDVSPLRPVLVTQIYSAHIAAAVKTALARIFPEEHEVTMVIAAGVPGSERVECLQLHRLDRAEFDHLTTLWAPAIDTLAATRSPLTLHRIAAILRSPSGCPWDRKQTHATLRDPAIDEAYEVAEAIDRADPHELAEELGDLMLLVAMQAQIAEEAGEFSIGDVFDHVNRKLIRRHPHVFADRSADTPEDVVKTWNEIKREEKSERGQRHHLVNESPIDGFPRSMPATRRVARAIAKHEIDIPEPKHGASIGHQLLAAVQRAVQSGLDPERELESAFRRLTPGGTKQGRLIKQYQQGVNSRACSVRRRSKCDR